MSDYSTLDDVRQTNKTERYLMGVLFFINLINYMDRIGIASVLVEISEHFQIGDDLGGLLQTGLLIAYTASAPGFGYLGDRYSRKYILIGCVVLWCLSIVAGAFANRYSVLLLSRMLVGVGQSGFTTVSPTVISDIALRGARTIFLAIFYVAIPLGAGLGYTTVAFVSKSLKSWSYGLCVGPCLCVIGIALMSFASFPKRGEKEAAEKGAKPLGSTSYKRDILYLGSVPSFNLVTLGFTQICFYVGALSWWAPKCLYHGFQLIPDTLPVSLEKVAFLFGVTTIMTGLVGVLAGVSLSRLLRPRFASADAVICGVSLFVAIPFILSALSTVSKSKALALTLIFLSEVNLNLNWTLVTDMLLYVVTPTRRTSAQGMSMLFSHGFGDCISPYIVGITSEYFKTNYEFTNGSFFSPNEFKEVNDPNSDIQNFHSLQMSLCIVTLTLVVGGLSFFCAARFIKRDIEHVEKQVLAAVGNE